jgi:serine/threonine protein kinase
MSSDPSASPPSVTPTPAGDTRHHAAAPPSRDRFPFLDPPDHPDDLGRLPGYRILGELGAGGMGLVFRAHDIEADRPVAIKVILPPRGTTEPEHASAEQARLRFIREARAAAKLSHDHVVPIYYVGKHRETPFVVMPWLQGEPLHARLGDRKRPRLTVGEACRIARETAEGLAAAHEAGLVHRDIKPGNLWLEGKRARVKILDFGLARSAEDSTLTASGAVMGTPAYMAPEQGSDAKRADHRADLFSLGCVLYEMLAGRRIFDGEAAYQVMGQLVAWQALGQRGSLPCADANPDVPRALSDLVERLLAPKPEHRPASANEVAELLRTWEAPGAAALPTPAAPAPMPPTPTPVGPLRNAPGSTADTLVRPPSVPAPRRRRVGIVLELAGLIVAAVAALFVAVLPRDDTRSLRGRHRPHPASARTRRSHPRPNPRQLRTPSRPPHRRWSPPGPRMRRRRTRPRPGRPTRR